MATDTRQIKEQLSKSFTPAQADALIDAFLAGEDPLITESILERILDARFNEVDARFHEMDARFHEMEGKLNQVALRIVAIQTGIFGVMLALFALVT